MLSGIEVLCHSSIRIEKKLVMYIDPYKIEDEKHDADIIFCTHTHTDHFSEEDILKIRKDNTIFVGTEDSLTKVMKLGFSEDFIKIVEPNKSYEVLGINFETIPAYNLEKQYHLRENNWVGYILEINDIHYYIAGDTDFTPETKKLSCDVAFVPVGGRYTMNAKEAAALINTIEPQIAIPTHYGDIIGTHEDAELFKKLVKENIQVKLYM
jgi:L-ascorbate metabolism protein UlaG (beta-lactamase superfamily)